jgi:3-hydroxyacyl-CoA dehydrogenase
MAGEIRKVAVIGSGTMGAGIAALAASKGADVLLLDMPAKEGDRNAIAAGARGRMLEGKAPMLDDPAVANRIHVGNFDDDLGKLAACDWIVEVIVENLAIKRQMFERLEKARRDGSILTTNTSGIPLHAITEGMPARLQKDVAVTHFFNPVKVMKLVELVPGAGMDKAQLDRIAAYLDADLGKGVVWAKDTVNFIANRIGCFWMLAGLNEAQAALDAGLDIEDLDAALGAPVGVPPTALYGLLDLVGLDVLGLVATNLQQNLSATDAGRPYAQLPAKVDAMYKRGQIGRKAGGGFYRMSKADDGGRLKETFDLKTESWRPSKTATLTTEQQTLVGLLGGDDELSRFVWKTMGATMAYAADLVPQIADDIVNVDRAMRWGFNWRMGPFEMIDAVGAEQFTTWLRMRSGTVPKMLQVMQNTGAKSFYRNDGKEYLGVDGTYHPVLA